MSLLSADVRTRVIFDKALMPLADVLFPQVRQHESPLIPVHRPVGTSTVPKATTTPIKPTLPV